MITQVATVGVYVRDQQRAVDFYVNKLGFETRRDEPMSPTARWIELAPPGSETAIVPYTPEGMEDRIGTFGSVTWDCDDIGRTYEDLSGRGVEFSQVPAMQPWGMMMAIFKGPDGNEFVLVQRAGGAGPQAGGSPGT
jgi:catechol 2,3-dioxygenase-like lactoylglutathione lyase family enzyme